MSDLHVDLYYINILYLGSSVQSRCPRENPCTVEDVIRYASVQIWHKSLVVEVGNTSKNEAGEEYEVRGEDVEIPESEPPFEYPLAVPLLTETVKAVNRPYVFQEVRDDPRHSEVIPHVDVLLLRQGHEDDHVEENFAEFPVEESIHGNFHL